MEHETRITEHESRMSITNWGSLHELRSPTVSTELQRHAEQAAAHPTGVFTTLAHKMDEEWLREAYHWVRKGGAAGVDRVTAAEYARNLEANLAALHQQLK